MSLFSVFLFSRNKRRPGLKQRGSAKTMKELRRRLILERLEDRTVPSCNDISGHVFNDANDNGLLDPGESVLANSPIELLNASGVVIGTAVTDANGFYQFSTDSTINTAPTTLTRMASIANSPTDWTQTAGVQQFDPSLGTLLSVDIVSAGTFTSQIQVESLDSAPSTVTGTVSGALTLTGPGVTGLVTTGSFNETFNASAFDGVIDFGGTSGHDFGPQTASGTQSATLSAPSDLASYIGTGNVTFTEVAHATSAAHGAGNLVTHINSSASGTVGVVYHYIPSNCLRPGNYTVVLTSDPAGVFKGKNSSNGVVIPNSVGSHSIPVTLTNANSVGNDFAELFPASLNGFVYLDSNDDGIKEATELGIAGITVTLTGIDDAGNTVLLSQITGADGSYHFTGLRPGTYAVAETQPDAYIDGKDTAGSLGGVASNDHLSNIPLPPGTAGVNYNFGELLPSILSGFVYLDSNNDGIFESNESGIAGSMVTLSGTNDLGQSFSLSQLTGADGSYRFVGLRPGVYTLTQSQPSAYLDGKDTLGSIGGVVSSDQFSQITLPMATAGVNYNFGEVLPPSPSGIVYAAFGTLSVPQPPNLNITNKMELIVLSSVDPAVLRANMFFVDMLYRTVLGRGADPDGMTALVVALANGATRFQVAQVIWQSAEHRGIQVNHLYQRFFNRSADPVGLATWVNAMLNGMSEAEVARQLVLSPEYQATHSGNMTFIAGLYADVIGRQASPAEMASWNQALQSGLTRAALASIIINSAEVNKGIVDMYYATILGRPADTPSEQAFVAGLTSGQYTTDTVAEILLASDEFYAMAVHFSLTS
jgi:hypothetical protein